VRTDTGPHVVKNEAPSNVDNTAQLRLNLNPLGCDA
jgi:hypothetical protein